VFTLTPTTCGQSGQQPEDWDSLCAIDSALRSR